VDLDGGLAQGAGLALLHGRQMEPGFVVVFEIPNTAHRVQDRLHGRDEIIGVEALQAPKRDPGSHARLAGLAAQLTTRARMTRVFPGFAQFPVGVDIAEFSAQFIRRRTATR